MEPPSLRGLRPGGDLVRLRNYSDLIWTLTLHRLKVRYASTRLGFAWALLQPLSFMLVFAVMFSILGRSPSSEVAFPLFAYAGLVVWTSFAGGLSSAASSLTGHASLLTKVYFPREILPITYVAAALADLAAASLVLFALMAWYRVAPTSAVVWAVPAITLMALFLAAMGLLLSAVQVRHRDIGVALPVLLQVWMFASPVLYPLAAAKASLPRGLYAIYALNPMAAGVDTFRRAMVLGQGPDPFALTAGAVVTLALLPAAYVYFKHSERTMADVV
jgi:lipopolysaccharide transport system permease protein